MSAGRDKRLWCYKVAVVLLYGQVRGVERVAANQLIVDTSQLANHLGLPNHRLREYLRDLDKLNVVEDLALGHGWAKVKLANPVGWIPTTTVLDVG